MSTLTSPINLVLSSEERILRHSLEDARRYLDCRTRQQSPSPQHAEAWNRFYQTCSPLLGRFALACGVSAADLDDCIQAVWVKLLRALGDFHYEPRRGQFRSWIFTLVRTEAIDRARRRKCQPVERIDAGTAATLRNQETDPVCAYERRLEQETVRRALAELQRRVCPRSYRVLYLRSIEERTVAEVADTLHLTPAQVRYRHHRMKRKIRSLIDACTDRILTEDPPPPRETS